MLNRLRLPWPLMLCLALVAILAGCATPVGVSKVSPREAYRDAYAFPLSAGIASDETNAVLNRYDLLRLYENDPAAAVAALHDRALHDNRRDILYALAETAYLYGDQLSGSNRFDYREKAPGYFLLAALYAYLFILEERPEPPPTAFDPRFRNGCDLYNFSLWRGLATSEDDGVVLAGGVRILPIGKLAVTLEKTKFPWALEDFEKFEPSEKYVVRGFAVRERTPGVGLPLVGVKKPSKDSPFGTQAIPITAFLRLRGNVRDLSAGTATASLELYSTYDDSDLVVNNRTVPLETDITTPVGYKLEGSDIWGFGISAFLGKEFTRVPNGLYLAQPYQPGRIPVVFVHGTASSPVWWAEMMNTLRADDVVRRKYQFWYFVYSSNSPVAVSAADLRDALAQKVAALDPEEKDPALRQMVVVGHSQGGLLTKFTAVRTGDRLLRALTGRGLDELDLSAENKERVRRLVIVEPLPFVQEVIFIATPHRGSFRTTSWVRKLVRMLVTLPATIVETSATFYDYMTDDVKRLLGKNRIATSADGMSPDNPLIRTLADIPLAPGVKGHSIIAVLPGMDIATGNDGVVEYTSAHLEGMESEYIVRFGHSCQGHPLTIEEVRRILLEHLNKDMRRD